MSLFAMVLWLLANLFSSLSRTKQLARYDSLSRLYNRRTLEQLSKDEIEQCSKDGVPISALIIDIDNFKSVNDLHGHHVGDAGIKHVGSIVKQSIRKHDIAGRYGGDELVVLLPGVDLADAEVIAEKIRTSTEQSFFEGDKQVTISIGIAEASSTMKIDSFKDLCKKADLALYLAKENGRNCSACYNLDVEKTNKRSW